MPQAAINPAGMDGLRLPCGVCGAGKTAGGLWGKLGGTGALVLRTVREAARAPEPQRQEVAPWQPWVSQLKGGPPSDHPVPTLG